MKKTIHLLLLLIVNYTNGFGQTKPITDTLHSAILDETREFEIRLPQNYKPGSDSKFDVIYVLDGEDIAALVESIRGIGVTNELMPQFIIVGVHNRWLDKYQLNSRERDFLPAKDKDYPLSGGSDKFLSFFKEELIPYINRKYPSNSHSTLLGHSYGGLLTVYTALAHPEIFDSYIASDPSLWWHNGYINNVAASYIILVHNHPSGALKPSQADIMLTQKLVSGGHLLDLGVIEHIILTSEGYFSFADEGMM